MRIKAILNPCAGQSGNRTRVSDLRAALATAGFDHDLSIPSARGGMRLEAIAAVAAGYEAVVAAGGDGTINEVINGLIAAAGDGATCPLGVLPLGTGNDFSDMAGVPRDLEAAANVIAAGKTRQLDAGWVSFSEGQCQDGVADVWRGHYFGNNCAVAMEPMVTLESNRLPRLSGNIRYLVAMLRGFLRMKAWTMQVTWDGGRFESATYLLSVANGPRTGGLFTIAPGACFDDGLFDFVFAPEMPKWEVLTILPRLFKGTHVNHPKILSHHTKRLSVTSHPGTPIHADGEIIGQSATHIRFQILPGKITLLAP